MSYAIIRVELDYDHIESAKVEKLFETKEECDNYVAKLAAQDRESYEKHKQYVREYIAKHKLEYHSGYYNLSRRPDFKPPITTSLILNLFIVELKERSS